MNIFVTSPCPYESARYLDDKRVIKMVLESVQLLSTAVNEIAGKQVGPYRTTHKNHPCAVWARQNRANFNWLVRHAAGLAAEYKRRYGKTHKSASYIGQLQWLGCSLLPPGEKLTPFANCARHKGLGIEGVGRDVHECYRDYLNQRWLADKRPPSSTIRRAT